MHLEAISMHSEAISMQFMTHLEAELLPKMDLRAQMQQRLVEGLCNVPVPLTPRLAHELHRGQALHQEGCEGVIGESSGGQQWIVRGHQ